MVDKQVSSLHKAFSNKSLVNVKLSTTQFLIRRRDSWNIPWTINKIRVAIDEECTSVVG